MGTHPIFESDFDCLTEIYRLSCEKVLFVLDTLKEDLAEKDEFRRSKG